MRILLLFVVFFLMTSNAFSVVELSKKELGKYNHIKKIPIAFANWGNKQKELTVDPLRVCKEASIAKGNIVESDRKMKITQRFGEQISFATKCNKIGLGYVDFLRVYTDSRADKFCARDNRIAIFAGEAAFKLQPLSRLGQVAAGVYTLGLSNTKTHVSTSYFCSLEKDPDLVYEENYNKYVSEFKNKSLKNQCEVLTDPLDGSMLDFDDLKTSVHTKFFKSNESECKKLTGRYTDAELAEIAIKKENEKKARELEIARLEAEEKEKKRLAILERKRLDKIEIERVSKLGNEELCRESLSENGDLKSSDGVNKFQIEEIKAREISQSECRKITGIYPKEVLARMIKREECEEMGFKDSEKIADCILRLIEAESLIKAKEIEAAENKKIIAEQTQLDKVLEEQMAQFQIEQKKLDVLLKQLEQAESQTAAAQEQAAAARAQAAAAALAASEAKKANRREGLKEAERQIKKGACIASRADYWNC